IGSDGSKATKTSPVACVDGSKGPNLRVTEDPFREHALSPTGRLPARHAMGFAWKPGAGAGRTGHAQHILPLGTPHDQRSSPPRLRRGGTDGEVRAVRVQGRPLCGPAGA